jgi:phospholipid-binding lipoprotein MlaA
MRTGISNFFDNLDYPVVILNDLLQARFKQAGADTGRLLMNTTLGIGGLLDPASSAGLTKYDNDFGLTLARWGAGKGPFLELPFLGPSDIRDGAGRIPDSYASPRNYIGDTTVHYSLWAVALLDARYRLLSTDPLVDAAYDPYLFVKNAYLQRRDYLENRGLAKPKTESDADKLLDEATKDEEESNPPPPPPEGAAKPQDQGTPTPPPAAPNSPPAPPPK